MDEFPVPLRANSRYAPPRMRTNDDSSASAPQPAHAGVPGRVRPSPGLVRRNQAFALGLAASLSAFWTGLAVTPSSQELLLARQWAENGFGATPTSTSPSLKVVSEDAADLISWGRSWTGTPFQIGEKTYAHGLAFNSTKRLRINLGRPGSLFRSDIGLENNDDTRRGAETGNGSITFHVLVKGVEVLTSPVMKLKDAPRSIEVLLQEASEFEILVGDGGDGRGWDQALWGGAEIVLLDGSRLRLQDLARTEPADANLARVSFLLDGKPSMSFLPEWRHEHRESPLSGGGESREVTHRDPKSGIEVRVVSKRFADFPAVEWVAYLKNSGTKDTPLLENILPLDTSFSLPGSGQSAVHWAKGGVSSFDDFAPQKSELKPGQAFKLAPGDGRSSSEILPFFNLEGRDGGVVLAVGWSGRWAAQFEGTNGGTVRARAGMAQTRLVLHPGEEIRTPSMLALFYEGNRRRGQNLLRQFILAHHRPVKDGQPMRAPITCGNWGGSPASVHMENIRKFIEHQLPMDYYWIDAEWYGQGGWAGAVGDWRVKQDIYPQGFSVLSDLLKKDGRELMLWFEPERVCRGTPWQKEHPEWLLDTGGENLLMNLGHPDARRFITDFISSKITEFGLGCYRQDFNIDPRSYWEKADAENRQGISEIRHIEGLYAFWDGLLAKHPHLIIDNCASGGRRIDLETIGRATPFWRTDGPRDAIAHQCHSYGLLDWVPLSAISQDREGDTYEFRSSMCSSLCINWNHSGDGVRPSFPADFPFDWAKRTLDQYVRIRDFYYGDYYPLTEYSQAADQWMAYQLDRPDLRQGLVVVLRRPASPYETARLPLQGINRQAAYWVTNLDTGERVQQTGRELAELGLHAAINSRPGSSLFLYAQE